MLCAKSARAIRVAGADCAWLLLPRPGRTIGWPPEVPGAPRPAVLMGRADAAVGLLSHEASGWHWTATAPELPGALKAEMLTARTGARALADAVTASAEQLERLGLERPARDAAARTWEDALARLPRGLDPQVAALLDRLAALHDALDLALADDGAAVTAGEARARAAAIRGVVGDVEDVLAGLVGGLNAPAFVSGRAAVGHHASRGRRSPAAAAVVGLPARRPDGRRPVCEPRACSGRSGAEHMTPKPTSRLLASIGLALCQAYRP